MIYKQRSDKALQNLFDYVTDQPEQYPKDFLENLQTIKRYIEHLEYNQQTHTYSILRKT